MSNKVSVPNKADELNISVFNLITGINKSEILTKHISCGCKSKLDERKCNSDQKQNNDKYWCDFKRHNIYETGYIWNPATCSCENDKILEALLEIQWLRVMTL